MGEQKEEGRSQTKRQRRRRRRRRKTRRAAKRADNMQSERHKPRKEGSTKETTRSPHTQYTRTLRFVAPSFALQAGGGGSAGDAAEQLVNPGWCMHGPRPTQKCPPSVRVLTLGDALKSRRMLAGQISWERAPLARRPKARSARRVNMARLMGCVCLRTSKLGVVGRAAPCVYIISGSGSVKMS